MVLVLMLMLGSGSAWPVRAFLGGRASKGRVGGEGAEGDVVVVVVVVVVVGVRSRSLVVRAGMRERKGVVGVPGGGARLSPWSLDLGKREKRKERGER